MTNPYLMSKSTSILHQVFVEKLAVNASSGSSAASAAFAAGGNPGNLTSMEVFTAATTFSKQVEGQLFFNSTTNTFKETIFDVPGATWASGGDLNTARTRFGGAGQAPQSPALGFGGSPP